jgi:hypothetical protein
VSTRAAFLKADVPTDFERGHGDKEREYQHDDHGARVENIISTEGLRAMGLLALNEHEDGLTLGQKEVRRAANRVLGL